MQQDQIKPITRALTIKGDKIHKKVETLCKLVYGDISDSELLVLVGIVTYAVNNSLFITMDISNQIRLSSGLKESAFSTGLFRLAKRGVIRKEGKTVTLNLLFSGVMDMDRLLINFVSADKLIA